MYATFVTTWFAQLWPLLEPGMHQVREAYGLARADGWPAVFAAHDLLLPVVPRAFDAPVPGVPGAMRYFGFLVPDAATAPTTVDYPGGDGPTVLVGLSTTYLAQETLLASIVDALGSLPVRAIVTTAGHVGDGRLRGAANVTIADYVPHGPLLRHTDLMVTHAGMASVAGALAHGVPLVCTPISRDQPLNAQRVADCGAGIDLGPQPDAGTIATAVERVLAEPAYRAAAQSLAEASRNEGGVAAAARACVDLT
jgi:MGT family glycosyltransferase